MVNWSFTLFVRAGTSFWERANLTRARTTYPDLVQQKEAKAVYTVNFMSAEPSFWNTYLFLPEPFQKFSVR